MFFSDMTMPASFYILRHGETVANADGRIQGRSEYPLNDAGRQQAEALASWLGTRQIRAVFHSPLSRAAETATIVSRQLGLEHATRADHSLIELDTGRFSGLTLDEARVRYPDVFARFQARSWEAVPDAERSGVLYERAIDVWIMLKKAAIEAGGNVAAVSHGGTIQWIIRSTFGCRTWMPLISTGNCAVFELRVEPSAPGAPAFMHWKEFNRLPGTNLKQTPPVF